MHSAVRSKSEDISSTFFGFTVIINSAYLLNACCELFNVKFFFTESSKQSQMVGTIFVCVLQMRKLRHSGAK